MGLKKCLEIAKKQISIEERDFLTEKSKKLQEKGIDEKTADRRVLSEMRSEIDKSLSDLRSKLSLKATSEGDRKKIAEDFKKKKIEEINKKYDAELKEKLPEEIAREKEIADNKKTEEEKQAEEQAKTDVSKKEEPIDTKPEMYYEDAEAHLKAGNEITGELEYRGKDLKNEDAISMKTEGGKTLRVMRKKDASGNTIKNFTTEDITSGKPLSLELIEASPENIGKVGAEAIVNGKFKFKDNETLYPSVMKVMMEKNGEKVHIGNVQYTNTEKFEAEAERRKQLQFANSFMTNYKFSNKNVDKAEGPTKLEVAKENLRDSLGKLSNIKGVMPFGNEKEKNDFINSIRDVIKSLIVHSSEWMKEKYGGISPAHLKKATFDWLESQTHENIDNIVKYTKKAWDEIVGKDFEKIKNFSSTLGQEISKEEDQSLTMDAQAKLNSLRKPTRTFFKLLENFGVLNAERKVIDFTKTPELEIALQNEDTYREWLTNNKNPDIKTIFEALDSNEGGKFVSGYQKAIYLSNVYSNTFMTEHIAYNMRTGVGDGDKYVKININKSGLVTAENKSKVAKHLSTYTFDPGPGLETIRDAGQAIQARHQHYQKKQLPELNNKYRNKLSNLQGIENTQKRNEVKNEKKLERHELFLDLLSDLSGFPKRFWSDLFNPKLSRKEKEYTDYLYSTDPNAEVKTPRIITAMTYAQSGRRYSDKAKMSPSQKIVKSMKYFFNETDSNVQDNMTTVTNISSDKGSLAVDFKDVNANKASSLEQNSHLLKSLFGLDNKKYDSEFYKNNPLIHGFFRKNKIVPVLKKLNGTYNTTSKDANESKDVTDSELMTTLVLEYVRAGTEYNQSLGQFADKNHIYFVEVPKMTKNPVTHYEKLIKARGEVIASNEEIKSAAKEYMDNTYTILDSRDRLIIDKHPGGKLKYYEDMMYSFALNKLYLDDIVHGSIGQYGSFENLIKRSGTVNTPGYTPNKFIEGGIGYRKNPITGEEEVTNHFNHVIVNDLVGKVLNDAEYKFPDGLELMTQEWADRLQVSQGDVLSLKDKYDKLENVKSSYSTVDENGKRALTKGNVVSVDVLARTFPESVYPKLRDYMKKHGVDRLSFESTTKLYDSPIAEVFNKKGEFTDVDPVVKARNVDDIIIQQELRHSIIPDLKKDSKQSIGNDMPFHSSTLNAKLYNQVHEMEKEALMEQFGLSNQQVNDFLIKEIDKDVQENLHFHLMNNGSRKNPIFQKLIQSIIASKATKDALERKIQRTMMISVPQMDVSLKPRKTLSNGKIALEWASTSQRGVREAKEFEFDPKDNLSKLKAEMTAKEYAKQFKDMVDGDGNLRDWEIITEGNKVVVPGEWMRITRVPADGPRSHSLVRQYKRIDSETNFIAVHAESQLRSGEDNDGDERFVQTLFKHKNGDYVVGKGMHGLMNQALLNTAKEYYKPENNKFFERILNTKLFQDNNPYIKKLIAKSPGFKSNDPAAYVKIRRSNQVGNTVIGIQAIMSSTFDNMSKHRVKLKPGNHEIAEGLFINDIAYDKDGNIKDAIGTILNLAFDNVKDPQIEKMGINEKTAEMFTALMISNSNVAKSGPDQMKRIGDYTEKIVKYLNSPIMKEFVRLERERRKVTSTETLENTFEKLKKKGYDDVSISKIKLLNNFSQDVKTISDYVKLGLEMPKSYVEIRNAKRVVDKVESRNPKKGLKYINTSEFINSPFFESTHRSIEMAEKLVLENDITNTKTAKTFIDSFEKNKGKMKDQKLSYMNENEFKKLSNLILQTFSVKALRKKGDNLIEIEKELEKRIEKTDDFTKLLQYNYGEKKIQLINNENQRLDLQKAHIAFDKYSPELKRKWLSYFHYKYGNATSTLNGGFYDAISRTYMLEADKMYENEFKRWENDELTPEEISSISDIIKFMRPNVDFTEEFGKVHGKRTMPDIDFKDRIYGELTKIENEVQFNEYLKELNPFEKKFANEVLEDAHVKKMRVSHYATEKFTGKVEQAPEKIKPVAEVPDKIEFSAKSPEFSFLKGTTADAKELAKADKTIDSWEDVKTNKIFNAIREKMKDPINRQKLKATEGSKLVYKAQDVKATNDWWGVNEKGEGFNKLGKILESVREEIILEDAAQSRTDIIERLKRLQIKNDKLYDAVLGIPIATWNGLVNLAVVGVRTGRAIKEVTEEVRKTIEQSEWYTKSENEYGSFGKAFKEVLEKHAIEQSEAIAGRDPALKRDEKKAADKFKERSGGKLSLDQKEKIKVSEFAETIGENIVDGVLKEKGFDQEEIEGMTRAEQLEYATGRYDRGEVRTYQERVHETDESKTETAIQYMSEEKYLQMMDIKTATTETTTTKELEDSKIPYYTKMHESLVNAKTKSYRKYLQDTYFARRQINRLEGITKTTSLDDLVDINEKGILDLMKKIQGMDVLASESIRNYTDNIWKIKTFRDIAQSEYLPGFQGPKLATRAIGEVLGGKFKDFEFLTRTPTQLLLMHRNRIDKKHPLLQFVIDQELSARRESNQRTSTFASNVNEWRKELGLRENAIRTLFRTGDRKGLSSANNPDWMVSVNPSTNEMQLLEVYDQNFERMLDRPMSREEKYDAALLAKSVKENFQHNSDLPKKEQRRIIVSSMLLNEIRKQYEEFHPTISEWKDDPNKGSYTIPLSKVYMSPEESILRFGRGRKEINRSLHELLKPGKLDSEIINEETGQTFGEAKLDITSKYGKTIDRSQMIDQLKLARKKAKKSYLDSDSYPDLRESLGKIKTIQAAGIKDVELPKEFRSDDFWYIISEATKSMTRTHYKRQFAPIAEYALGKFGKQKNITKWLQDEIDFEIYGINKENEYWGESAKKAFEHAVTFAAYNALSFNMKAAGGNIMAGYTQNAIQMPKETFEGLKMITANPNRFGKAMKVMEALEIATVVSDAELKTLSRAQDQLGKFAFFTMEFSERLIQVPVALGLMGNKIDNYDAKGRLKAGHEGLTTYEALNIKNSLQNIHGAYGDSRAHYSHYLFGRAAAQFRWPWMQSIIHNYWGKETTDYLGNYRIGSIPAMIKELKRYHYNMRSPEKRESMYKGLKSESEKDMFFGGDAIDNLILGSEGNKIRRKNMPKELKNAWRKNLITGGLMIGLAQTIKLLLSEEEQYEKSKNPEELKYKDRVKAARNIIETWYKDVSIPLNYEFWTEQTSRPIPSLGMGDAASNLGKNVWDYMWGNEEARYQHSSDQYAEGELKMKNGIMKLLPGVGKLYLHSREAIRRARGSKYAERIKNDHDEYFVKMILADVMKTMAKEGVRDDVVIREPTKEWAEELLKKYYNDPVKYGEYISNYEKYLDYMMGIQGTWEDIYSKYAETTDHELFDWFDQLDETNKEMINHKTKKMSKKAQEQIETKKNN